MSAISVGSVSVDVVPSTETFAERLRAKLQGITADVKVTGDTESLRKRLETLTRARETKIVAKADTRAAEAQLDKAARDRTVNLNASSASRGLSGMMQAIIGLAPLVGPLAAGVAGLGAALGAPIAAAGGGLTVYGLLAGAAVAQTKKQQQQLTELRKKAQAAQTALANTNATIAGSTSNQLASAQRSAALRMTSAQQAASRSLASAERSLAGAKTASARAAAQARVDAVRQAIGQRGSNIQASLSARQATITASAQLRQSTAQRKAAEATQAYQNALARLAPAQRTYIDAQGKLKASLAGLLRSNGTSLLGPLTAGMGALAAVLPKLGPLITPVANAISRLLGDVEGAAKGPAFKAFLTNFGSAAGSAIVSFGRIFENFAKGLFGIFQAFAPLAADFTGWLTRISESFAQFGAGASTSAGFRSFIDYIRTEGPKVGDTLLAVADAVGHIVVALAPIGGVELQIIKNLSEVIASIPTPTLTALAVAAAAAIIGFKGYRIWESASGSLDKLSVSLGKLTATGEPLSRAQTVVRGFAGAGGLGLLASSASSTNHALGILGSAGGGALLGFAVGGPVGAAVGAGAGALLGLWEQTRKSTHAFAVAQPVIGDYANSLDQLSGKVTKLTRDQAFQALFKSGAIDAGKKFGLSAKTLVDATLGDPKALARYNAAVKAYTTARGDYMAQLAKGGDVDKGLQKHLADLAPAYNALTSAVGGNAAQFKKDIGIARDERLATLDLKAALKGLPAKAITEIGIKGFPKTVGDVLRLTEQYHLTPKEISTLVKVSGVDTSVKQIDRMKRHLDELARPRIAPVQIALNTHAKNVMGETLAGARADGGPVYAGRSYKVGERGVEVFTPSENGSITPNSHLTRAGVGPQFNVERVYAQDVNDFLRQMQTRSRMAGTSGVR